MKRKRLDESKHPFDEHPFEGMCNGSWRSVEFFEISDGSLTVRFSDNKFSINQKGPFSNVRLKSRKATVADCTCFIRPGIDICVLLPVQNEETSETSEEWIDCRVRSVKRKPHEPHCECQFFIRRHINQGPLGTERVELGTEVEEVGVDRIRLLQKVDKIPCEGQFYRWDSSEDCSTVQRTKLFIGKFCSDLTWLLVASVLRQFAFDVRSVQHKIVYQILGCESDFALSSSNHLNALSFKVENGVLTPLVLQFSPTETSEISPSPDIHEEDSDELYSITNLRRSKRRNVKPERFLGCDVDPDAGVGWVRCMPYKPKEDEMFVPLSLLFTQNKSSSPETTEKKRRGRTPKNTPKIDSPDDLPLSKFKKRSKENKERKVKQEEPKNGLSIVPASMESDSESAEDLDSLETVLGNGAKETYNDFSVNYYKTKSFNGAKKEE